MKKITKRIFSAILSAIMLILALPLTSFAVSSATYIEEGDIVEFGTYPQSTIDDSALIKQLDSVNKDWVSYGYYSGTGEWNTAQQGDWMKYADFSFNGCKYRAVTFSKYRPSYTYWNYEESKSQQYLNGYKINEVYYFLYEPIKWKVESAYEDHVFLNSLYVLDSQAFRNIVYAYKADLEYDDVVYYFSKQLDNLPNHNPETLMSYKKYYAHLYEDSDLKEWLNSDFYNTGFNGSEKAQISNTITTFCRQPVYDYDESAERESIVTSGTDYAASQGLRAPQGPCSWWTKDGIFDADYNINGGFVRIENVDLEEGDPFEGCLADSTCIGVRPAIYTTAFKATPKGVTSVKSKDTPYLGSNVKLNITVKNAPTKIRFVDSKGNSMTIERTNSMVTDIITYPDGSELWSINFKIKALTQTYKIYTKYAQSGWYEKPYDFTLTAQERETDKDVYSFSIDECYDDVMYAGVHTVTVETGVDATKVQFYKDGNTWTYSADNASYVIEDDKKIWSINMNFSELGEDMEYYIRTRSQKSAFEFTDQVMNVWVRFK